MRNLIIFAFALLGSVALIGQNARLEAEGYLTVCAGFGTSNQIKVNVVEKRIPQSTLGPIRIAYIYHAEHEQTGAKMWFSNQGSKWINIPFTGRYKIYAVVEFIMPDSFRPFMIARTNTIVVEGIECADQINP
jgi:hypothetical protein